MADDEKEKEMPEDASESTNAEAVKENETEMSPQSSSKNVSYENGDAIFTDEKTQYKYKWCKETSQWKPLENEHYKWCEETQKWILKVPLENEYYRWCDKLNQWIPKMKQASGGKDAGVYGYDEKEGCQIYTDQDGAVFFWDQNKKAWFPRVDDDFLAIYQLNYGFIDNTTPQTVKTNDGDDNRPPQQQNKSKSSDETNVANEEDEQSQTAGKKRKLPAAPPKWFDIPAEQNSKVYVSNLPLDITDDEFSELMNKCGMVMKDLRTGKLKLKLYRDPSGELKGDGLCHYIKVESVDLALNVLDGYDIRGKSIKVQRAEFQMRGEYNPALKPRMRKQEKEKMKKIQEKLFDWRPEKMRGERGKHEKVVIIKNLFEPELFDREVHLIIDYQNDLRDECGKCGTVRKVVIYDRHPEGVAQVNMADPQEADLVVKLMNGRFFGQRKLTADTWDGKTKYKIDESENDKNERLQKWENFLVEDEDAKKEIASTKTPTAEEASGVDNEEIPEEQQPSENVESKIEAS